VIVSSVSLIALAQAGGAAANPLVQFLPIVVIFGIFYFLLIAPMRKRQKALAALVENLKKGDRVVTNGGIYGEIALVEGNVVHLKIADSVRVRIAKSAIAGLEGGEEGEAK
jgi:preprotein translocase subunit YajC